jgi:phosphohistidine phosphatase
MKRLILFRHGRAEPHSSSGDDFDRKLDPQGVTEAAVTGRTLADLGMIPDVALISPATRARETWAAAQPAFPDTQVEIDGDLYNADSGTLRHAAGVAGAGGKTVLIVAHNPGLHELVLELLRDADTEPALMGRAMRDFPPGAAAAFLIGDDGKPAFDGLFFPGRSF